MKKFWNWKNQADARPSEERVLELYGTIAEESWFDDDVTPQMFREELFSGSGPVTIWINSPGGDCIAASQIYSMLMDYKGNVTVKIAYLYEHREDADMDELTRSLRYMLSTEREAAF